MVGKLRLNKCIQNSERSHVTCYCFTTRCFKSMVVGTHLYFKV